MSYDKPLKNIAFDGFDIEERKKYQRALNPENVVIFRNAADLLDDVEEWLATEYPGGEFVAGRGKDRLADAVIVIPKATGEINTDFSKNVQDSQLAKKKSKFGPQ